MSPELRLLIAPRDAYATLARASGRGTLWTAVRRPLTVALVLGAATAMSGTGRVTPSLLFSTTACWSFVVVIQAAIALTLVAGPARRTVGLTRAIDLYFAGHAPWSLWMLAAAAWSPSPIGRPVWPLLAAAFVPLVLTSRILAAYFREVLEMDPRDAFARAAAQQAMTWATFVVIFGGAVALTPRVLAWFA
jgi:hypothetical protein